MVRWRRQTASVMMRCRLWAMLVTIAAFLAVGSSTVANAAELEPGFRQLEGRHLTLVTDLPAQENLDELPKIFDAAFPEWCRYFGLDADRLADWRATGYLMKSQERFQQAGYWQANLPPFHNGYSAGLRFWFFDQTSPYYRRHLMLHEGLHSFVNSLVGEGAPAWYTEGIAELLATHRWKDGQLRVGVFPATSREMQQQGRIEIIQEAVAAGHPRTLTDVLALHGPASIEREAYGWTWGLAAFLDGHPRYRERFRSLTGLVREGNFEAGFRRLFEPDWHELASEWQVFVANIDYGYDFPRMAIDFQSGKPPAKEEAQVKIAADRGWQSSAMRLEAGKTYALSATGRYQLADKPAVWWCEPGGVTIRYDHGHPLGILLATTLDDAADASDDPWLKPSVVGLNGTISPTHDGTLYLRVNDAAGELGDNSGSLEITVRQLPANP